MDLAIGAGCLAFLKRALLEALQSIIPKLFALRADRVSSSAVTMTIDAYHSFHGTTFPYHPGVFAAHKNHVSSLRFLRLPDRAVNLKSCDSADHETSCYYSIGERLVWREPKGEVLFV
jgi:hypothetical protein